MRVNIYAEEMTDRLEIITKEIEGHKFTALRFYLELPATVNGQQYQGPFMHRPGDDDSAAVTFWGKRDLRKVLRHGLELLDAHYEQRPVQYKQPLHIVEKQFITTVSRPEPHQIETLLGYYLERPDGSRVGETFTNCGHSETDAMNNARLFAGAGNLLATLTEAERFIRGFEGDELQEGIDTLLNQIRSAISDAEPL